MKLCCYLAVWPQVPLYDSLLFVVHQYAVVIMVGDLTQRQRLR